ncbi:MAG TPA: hypothetical protein VHC22_29740 [Pirellulales bacterium]|nr:hypothetical protein [Pirellulales bacterium]
MVWIHVLFAVAVAIAFTAILFAIGRGNAYERGGWATALVLFGILFLTSWAGGIWLSPIGPQLFGAAWLPFLLMGFVVALLIAAMLPVRQPRTRIEAQESAAAEEVVGTTVTAFLWIFAVCLIAAITVHYAYRDQQRAGEMAGRPPAEVVR